MSKEKRKHKYVDLSDSEDDDTSTLAGFVSLTARDTKKRLQAQKTERLLVKGANENFLRGRFHREAKLISSCFGTDIRNSYRRLSHTPL